MHTIQMTVIAAPPRGATPLLQEKAARLAIVDGGPLTCICGSCHHEMLAGVRSIQVKDFAFRCHDCGAVNMLPNSRLLTRRR